MYSTAVFEVRGAAEGGKTGSAADEYPRRIGLQHAIPGHVIPRCEALGHPDSFRLGVVIEQEQPGATVLHAADDLDPVGGVRQRRDSGVRQQLRHNAVRQLRAGGRTRIVGQTQAVSITGDGGRTSIEVVPVGSQRLGGGELDDITPVLALIFHAIPADNAGRVAQAIVFGQLEAAQIVHQAGNRALGVAEIGGVLHA